MTTNKCSQCKRLLPESTFYYNNKNHTTCFPCYKRRRKIPNKCKDCNITASFNYEDEKVGIYCKKHSLPDMVNVISTKCIICKETQSSFNYQGKLKATHCSKCALPNMINIKSPKCIVCKMTGPNFNYENEKTATHCKKCALPDMIDIKHSKCIVCKTTRPSFNYENETKATHCKKCALPDMIDIKHHKCIVCKTTIPNYNYENEIKATHCKKCALPDMIDIKNPKCIVCKTTQPNFNYENEIKATHCKKCALSDMIDIKNPKCIVCKTTQPSFNYQDELNATHCKKCALPDMVNVKDPKCSVCNKRASYGIPCNRPSACANHKTIGMISNPRAKCMKRGCKNVSTYGVKKPIHCEEHKNDNDILLVERECSRCGKLDILMNDLCINFCIQDIAFQDYKKNQKVKEKRVLQILTSEFGSPTEYNHQIDRNCGHYEKEIGYDCKTHMIYIEVDERQHKSYCELGEINRMKNIFNDSGGIPIIFIRYNPDSFIDTNNKRQKLSQVKREELLVKWVKLYMSQMPKHHLSVKYLFYDGHSDGRDKYYNIDPYDTQKYYCKICDKEFYVEDIFKEHSEIHKNCKILKIKKFNKLIIY
jgi:hypothetical protein